VLWDCLPAGLFLGGAPLNVACHLQQLGRDALPVSALGRDFLGDEILRRARRLGLDTRFLPQLSSHPTGVVQVALDDSGQPSYEIVEGVAWDAIPRSDELLAAGRAAEALVYGSLAQRSEDNRQLIGELLDQTAGMRIFDVNLRPPFDQHELVLELGEHADLIKLNDDEVRALSGLGETAELPDAARALRERCRCRQVCVTAGADGAGLLDDDDWHWCDGREVAVKDTVGAGDSFMAALLDGLLRKAPIDQALNRACRLAEFVAASDGATPDLDDAPEEARAI